MKSYNMLQVVIYCKLENVDLHKRLKSSFQTYLITILTLLQVYPLSLTHKVTALQKTSTYSISVESMKLPEYLNLFHFMKENQCNFL